MPITSPLSTLLPQLEAALAAARATRFAALTPANHKAEYPAYLEFEAATHAVESALAVLRPLLLPELPAPSAAAEPLISIAPKPAPLPPDTTGPHPLTHPFKNTRPEAFVWEGQRYGIGTGLKQRAHRAVYEWVLHHLYQRDAARLSACLPAPEFTSQQGHPDFAPTPAKLREAFEIAPDFFAEVNLSAPHLALRMSRLLAWFGLPPTTLLLWVRPTPKKNKQS